MKAIKEIVEYIFVYGVLIIVGYLAIAFVLSYFDSGSSYHDYDEPTSFQGTPFEY